MPRHSRTLFRPSAVLLLATFFVTAAQAAEPITADTVAQSVYLGQAYVTGNVYLKAFQDDSWNAWPQRVSARPLLPLGHPIQTPDLEFNRVVNATGSEEYSDFAAKEGAGDLDQTSDIFDIVSDARLLDRQIGAYRAKGALEEGYSVIAWSSSISLEQLDWRNNRKPRPMTEAELKGLVKEPPNKDCTTTPAYLDSAKEILSAKIKGTPLNIRISEYSSPGCAGHLAVIYILDIWEKASAPKRFDFFHYVGAL